MARPSLQLLPRISGCFLFSEPPGAQTPCPQLRFAPRLPSMWKRRLSRPPALHDDEWVAWPRQHVPAPILPKLFVNVLPAEKCTHEHGFVMFCALAFLSWFSCSDAWPCWADPPAAAGHHSPVSPEQWNNLDHEGTSPMRSKKTIGQKAG